MTERRSSIMPLVIGVLVALVLALALALTTGRSIDGGVSLFKLPETLTLTQIRIPRVLLGLIAGASLALAGGVLQGLLRNPLATPFTLGLSGGAGAGAALAFVCGWGLSALGQTPVAFCAFSGALLAALIVAGLGRGMGGRLSPLSLLLAGVTVNFFFGSLILLFYFAGGMHETLLINRWLMGSLDVSGDLALRTPAIVFIVCVPLLLLTAGRLDALSLGERTARSLGVDPDRTSLICLALTGLIVGAVTAAAGPLSFVGLIVPHVLRLALAKRTGSALNRLLLPLCLPAGAAFLILADTLARTVLTSEIPVGVVTALTGGPFLLYMLRSAARRDPA